jgi:protoporphyrinogen oxidase
MTDVLIIGGGVAGLGAARAARQRGLDALVLEAGSRPGGLLDSFVVDGFRFDNAVHLSFATEPEVREIFDRTPYFEHEAVSLCWDKGHWLRHPVQNNLFPLPVEERVALIEGLARQEQGDIRNYRDWLVQQYGTPIAARWPLVYTEKYWTIPAEEMGTAWIGPRMRQAALGEVLLGAMAERAPNTYYVSTMRYPKKGGYRAFIEPMIEETAIYCERSVVSIDPSARSVRVSSGEDYSYRHLVSTAPLPDLLGMIEGAGDPGGCRDAFCHAHRPDFGGAAHAAGRAEPLALYL